VDGFNRDENRLGVAVQLCTLPWLGWIPAELTGCPEFARARLAAALGLVRAGTAELLAGYGGWQGRTRRDHRARCWPGWAGAGARPASASCWISFCGPARWSTTRRACCCSGGEVR